MGIVPQLSTLATVLTRPNMESGVKTCRSVVEFTVNNRAPTP